MSQNIISQSILGSRLNFNQNFPNNSSIINSSRVTENQIKTFPIPTQFPILPHKDWICTKCSNNNTKGTYSCKNCGQSIDTTMARLHSNTTVGQPLSEGSSALNTGSIVPTPFGLLHKFSVPDPKSFIFDATKGYFHDTTTGFFYDKNSDYYYNPKSNKWMFWCSKYSTYIDCSGGDVALKRSLQEEEYDLQQKRNSEKLNDSISVTSGSLAVQRRSENIMDDWMDLVKRVGAESSVKATTHSLNINSSNPQTEKARDNETSEREEKDLKGVINANAQKNIRDCILQNEKSLIDLYELLAQETDPKSIEKIQSQIDSFMSTTHSLQKLLDMLSRGNKIESPETQKPTSSSAIITPQFKRHITTKTIQNDDNCDYPRTIQENTFSSQFDKSASFLRRNVYEKQKDFGRTSEKSNISLRDAILEGKRTAFDEHIEQVERLRNSIGTTTKGGNKLNWSDTKGIALHKENNFEEQIRSMVDQQVEKQWTLSSSNSRSSHNRSPERNSSRRSRSRHRSRSRRRSRSRANRRSRSKNRRSSPSRRKRSRSRVYTRSHSRSRHNDKDDDEIEIISQHLTSSYSRMNRTSSRSPQPPPVLPMVFSPPPSKFVRRSEDVNSGIKEVLFNNSNPVRRVEDSVLTPQHDPVNFANMQNASSFFSGSINRHGMNSSFPGSSFPLPPPTLIQVGKSVIQQSKFANTPGVPPSAVQNKFLNSHFNNQRIPPYQSVPDVLIICSNCGKDGHSREVCPELNKTTLYQLPKNIPSQNRVIRNELESNNVTSTENNLPVGLCLNCGRYGHSQIGCLLPRITDNELQKKIRKAEDRQRLEQLDKLKIKRKAEKYTVRRKDPFIQRLRAVAPYGKITKEHVRLTCQRCSGLGHNWNECAREEVPRSTVKLINEKVGEFIKIFFVHLNEDNLVDFSKKFELFVVMDGIEKSGTVDPVGLQLQTRCNRGIVTKGDLRDLCTNCATLGHVPGDCTQMIACSKQHYEKMLTLVEAYRCLVKEGNGNFFLPRLEYTQNQQIPHNSSDNINNNSDTKTPDILILDSDEAFSSSKRKK